MAKAAGFSFGKVGKVEEAPKKKAGAKLVIEMKNVKKIGALDWLLTAATSVKDVLVTGLKIEMMEQFIAKGNKESFVGEEDGATASCQMRLRSSRSPLTEDELALLEIHNIPVGETELQADTFVFNPKYLADAKLMAKIEAALATVTGLPEDIIQHQEGKRNKIATEESITAAFKLGGNACAAVLPTLTTLAVSPKFEVVGGNVAPVMAEIAKIMALPELADVVANAKKKGKGE